MCAPFLFIQNTFSSCVETSHEDVLNLGQEVTVLIDRVRAKLYVTAQRQLLFRNEIHVTEPFY